MLGRYLLPGIIFFTSTLVPVVAAADLTDTEWAALKKTYLAKPRRIMLDDDGCDAVNFPADKEPSIANFYGQMLDKMPGNEFDVLVYCPGTVGFSVLNRTAFGDRQLGTIVSKQHQNITSILDEKFNTDPLELARQFARRNHYEFVVNMRVNDIHDCWFPEWLPEWKRNHPQLLCGTAKDRPPHGYWTSYDFAHREVRDRFVAYVKEWIDNYDPDGIMIDFFRNPVLFKSVARGGTASRSEMNNFTGMLQELRNYAESAGRKRGRPIYMAFRLPDTVVGCNAIGADVERWAKERLFDIYIAGSDQVRLAPWHEAAGFCRQNDLRFYASIDSSFINAKPAVFNRNSTAAFSGDVAAAFAAGAEGIYYFNMFYQPHYFSSVKRDPSKLENVDKTYFANRHNSSPFPLPKIDEIRSLPPLYQEQPLVLTFGKPRSVKIEIGDDFSRYAGQSETPQARLFLKTNATPANLAVRINDHPLENGVTEAGILSWPVPLSCLKQGINRIELQLTVDSKPEKKNILVGDTLLSGSNQPPWRRLFPGNAGSEAETISNGAYLLTSSGKGAVNLLAPVGGLLGADFDLMISPGSDPGTGVLRIADGRKVEELEFRPDEIRARFSGKTIKFNTADRFHHYEVTLNEGMLTLTADGAGLLTASLQDNAENQETKLQGHHLTVPDMHRSGILIGGLNPTGRGAGAWKNVRIASKSVQIADLALEVKFPRTVNPRLQELANSHLKWDFEADFSSGQLPQLPGMGNNYRKLTAAPGGTGILLDNDLQDGAAMNANALPFATRRNRALVVDWEVTPVRTPEPTGHQVFQMLLRPALLNKPGHYEFMIRSADGQVVTAQETIAVPRGTQKLRAVIDAVTGETGIFLDGKPLTSATVGIQNYGSGITWGDISRTISGAVALKHVRIAAIPLMESDNPIAGCGEPEKWDYSADFSGGDGRIPPPAKSSYRNLAPDSKAAGLLLDQENGGGFDSIAIAACPLAEKRSDYFLAEWQVVPVRAPADPRHGVFQFAMRPLPPEGEYPYEFVVNTGMKDITTPWGRCPAADGGTLRAAADLRAGYGAVFLNGRLLAHGRLVTQKNEPGVFFGDNSAGISGAAALKSVKLTWR